MATEVLRRITQDWLESLEVKPKKDLQALLKGLKTQDRFDKVLIVLLDRSGSMLDSFENTTKIKAAQQVLQSELLPNMAGWTYGLLIFHGYRNVDWIVYPGGKSTALSTVGSSAEGETPMRAALEVAWGWVRQNAVQSRFVMLSDGEPTDSSKDEILRLAELQKSIPIDVVGIGTRNNFGYDPVFLANLARVTGGMFVEVSSIKMLGEAILKLSPNERPLLGPVKE